MKRIYQLVIEEHLQNNSQMVFLSGPRQVGKTTISKEVESTIKQKIYLNWDVQSDRHLIIQGQESIAKHLGFYELQEDKSLIIFDEIHKYGRWKNFLKGFYDSFKNKIKIIVTGSAKLSVYRKGGDSLMGRYFPYRIHPISVAECVHKEFSEIEIQKPRRIDENDFQNLWNFGGFPEPFLHANARFSKRWQRLRHEQLFREDIRELSQIQEVAQLELLATLLNLHAGQRLNLSALANKVNVSVNTIRRWLTTLEKFYFCFTIKPWSKNISRSLLKEPKLYLWDWSTIEDPGAKYENFIASHLLKAVHFWTDTGLGDYDLYFIRDKEKREVDFLVTKNGKPWFLVEAKSSNHTSINQALYRFQEQLKAKYAFQVILNADYVDQDCFMHESPIIVPARTFLSQLI